MKASVALMTVGLVLSGCSQSKDSNGGAAPAPAPNIQYPYGYTTGLNGQPMANVQGSFMYEHKEFGRCSTGKQIFNSLQEMCNGLLNESLNQNCAQVLRNQDYFLRCRQGGMNYTGVNQAPGYVQPGMPGLPNTVITSDRVKAVWCGITAQDNSGKLFSSFKNRDNQKIFSWDSKTSASYSLPFGLTSRYGTAMLSLTPSDKEGVPTAKISLKQKDSDTEYSVKGGLNQSVRLYLEDQRQDITVAIDCGLQADKTVAPVNFASVVCEGQLNGDQISMTVPWDGHTAKSQQIEIESKNSAELSLDLIPGISVNEAQVQVSSNELARGKRVLGKGTLRGGFEIKQSDASSARLSLALRCSAR